MLIVDDYVDALDLWAIYLRSIGYRVSTAADGPSAVAKAEDLLPDLIVLDLELRRGHVAPPPRVEPPAGDAGRGRPTVGIINKESRNEDDERERISG